MKSLVSIALLSAAIATPALAQQAPSAPAPAVAAAQPAGPPKLIVAISVDQFSADLFAEYRGHFSGGLARLLGGTVFPSGYQSHAATETCPGHSTILTGFRPEHTGITANYWIDQSIARPDKQVYCAEDETMPGSSSSNYIVSDKHLLVPTLGERMKAANPATRVVSVAGKDRAAVMMGGHRIDEAWWWSGTGFASFAGRPTPAVVTRTNAAVTALITRPQPALDLPDWCAAHDHVVQVGTTRSVGTGHFDRAAGDVAAFRGSPAFDAAIFALGAGLVQDMKLGQGAQTDIIAIGASATDVIGHNYGTEGAEMCIQVAELDRTLDSFFAILDQSGVDYEVMLTADHGGNDVPERERASGIAEAQRADVALAPAVMGKAIAAKLGIAGPTLLGDIPNGDVFLAASLSPAQHKAVLAEATSRYKAMPQVAAVFTAAQIARSPEPGGPPENWTLLEKARASFNPAHSGALVVFLKPRVTPIPDPGKGYIATHGSPYNYDRRVPILFWRKGMAAAEHPAGIETVDIMPTLAAQIGLPLAAPAVDGKCRDLATGDVCP